MRIAIRAPVIAVIGSSSASAEESAIAEEVGRRLADEGAILLCGGRGGVMEAACRGARQAGGFTVGILPGTDPDAGNSFLSLALPTGLGQARNAILIQSAEAVIAVGGGYGTLSEIGHALKAGKPLIGLLTWEPGRKGSARSEIRLAQTAGEAVERALESVRNERKARERHDA
jgi:uncharacterized protein (TIGR00725 family)